MVRYLLSGFIYFKCIDKKADCVWTLHVYLVQSNVQTILLIFTFLTFLKKNFWTTTCNNYIHIFIHLHMIKLFTNCAREECVKLSIFFGGKIKIHAPRPICSQFNMTNNCNCVWMHYVTQPSTSKVHSCDHKKYIINWSILLWLFC